MTFSSKYDDIPDGLVHAPGMLEETAQVLDRLTEASFTVALQTLSASAAQRAGRVSADELVAEAQETLRELLQDPEEADSVVVDDAAEAYDREWLDTLRHAVTAEVTDAMAATDLEWLRPRAADLARAVATYWWGLGLDHDERARAAYELTEQCTYEQVFEELARRFGLPVKDARLLLAAVGRSAHELAMVRLAA